ncbi:flagellar export chaperone FliS [Sphingomonas sp. 35-24ZXX]|jgi:flagellar protein FliS|uniref:flagellar export chaperone FliS n=1 Tax=Sphingomonas sp. 35-24ZXX TaxID=1545915 RepID=UPI00053BD91F|nr:flagellar protein FliS [Sphingomonas sp. 35-24ZXX]
MSFISPRRNMVSYKAVDTVSRVEGASPHRLVLILFDELLLRLDASIRHAQRGETIPMIQSRARASAIVIALEESLDYEKGGELALALARIYREASRRINDAMSPDKVDLLMSARQMLAEIAEAWRTIGPQ